MAVTLANLRTRVRYFCNDASAVVFPAGSAELDSAINDAQLEVAGFLSKQEGDMLLREATTTLTENVTDYAYPADIFGRNIRALYYYPTTGPTLYKKIERGTLEEVYDLGTTANSNFYKYCCLDGYFKIGPPPNSDASTITLRIVYIRVPTTLSSASDNMDFDDEFKELVACCAAIRCMEPRGGPETLQFLINRKAELLEEAARLVTKEDITQQYPAWKY